MVKKGKLIHFPNRKPFPNVITLENLVGQPFKTEIPILFGMDTAPVRILEFSIKCDFFAIARLIFDSETYKFDHIKIVFDGMEWLSLEESDEIYEQKLEEELSMILQARKILKDHKELSIYYEALGEYFNIITDEDY
ncbi:hypothetical protein [Cytobacillus kochii]|uniref:hypothetical protein n=1 Tax=Cytobacillus kochii TaxID=859143 RepID=UPI00203F7B4C|nr:hypothetical protein [Cytobacillus kochii]MCM3323285.1 hypothetical protein [Cytobacillus kochii]MCM3345680.1 hypothetical protein [Cytobacillus kochii]